MALKEISSNRSFGGFQKVYQHESTELKCDMNFSIYLPPQSEDKKLPVLYWLSGLTCTEDTFIQKSGFQRYAAEHGVIVVGPDTSPRGADVQGEEKDWDFGTGAGFYIDATEDLWKENYRMFSYVTKELPELINDNFPVIPERQGISGHSMGGHGALICALKNPGKYLSVSAFAPICNPIHGAWGQKAFAGYLGPDKETWKAYDATELAKTYNGPPLTILIDQGSKDRFMMEGQLLPDNFVESSKANRSIATVYRLQDEYDHSYFFVSSFIGDHIMHHMKVLNN